MLPLTTDIVGPQVQLPGGQHPALERSCGVTAEPNGHAIPSLIAHIFICYQLGPPPGRPVLATAVGKERSLPLSSSSSSSSSFPPSISYLIVLSSKLSSNTVVVHTLG